MERVPTSCGGAPVYVNPASRHAVVRRLSFEPGRAKLYEDLFFASAQKDYGWKRWYPERGGTPAQYEEALDGWHRMLNEITRK